MYRAYSLLTIKSIDDERRVIRGIATTPTPDQSGDIVEPLGVSFTNPLPLLLHHNVKAPIGEAIFDPPTAAGITFEAMIPVVTEPGILKDRTDEAWQSIKYGILKGASIGFSEVKGATKQLANGGLHFLKSIVMELSVVTIPANVDATILAVKSLDAGLSAPHPPAVAGPLPVVRAVKAAPAMTIQEQITQFENTRAAKAARMSELMTKAAADGVTLDDAQTTEYDGLAGEVKSVDAHLVRLHDMERIEVVKATPITATTVQQATEQRAGVITVKSMLPKGTAFTRMVMATARAKGDQMLALEYAKQWRDSTPEVELYMKAAVAAGTTTGATWALPLVPAAQNLTSEFYELLRPKTVLGRMTSLRKVPFNVAVPSQTAGGTYGWVGEGKPKPVTSLAFASVTLTQAKIAGIIVLTDELVRVSSPSAEEAVRTDMIAGVSQFMDVQFLDETVAAVANVSPASITNGIAPVVTAGSTADNAKTDIKALVAAFVAANLSLENAILIMSEANAFALGVAVNPLGQPMFPGFGAGGGTIMGSIPVITSQAAGSRIILVDQRGILYADEGGTTIDVSREASLQMDSAPDSPATATTVYASLWQLNMVGLRVERHCTWLRARTVSVKWTSGAAYV